MTTREVVCPSCDRRQTASVYDIGSGPEACCRYCEWCWGLDGQELDPDDARRVPRELYQQLPEWARDAMIPIDTDGVFSERPLRR